MIADCRPIVSPWPSATSNQRAVRARQPPTSPADAPVRAALESALDDGFEIEGNDQVDDDEGRQSCSGATSTACRRRHTSVPTQRIRLAAPRAHQMREALAEPGRERQRLPSGTTARNFAEKPMPASRP